MDAKLRIVTQLPLASLWDDRGAVAASRGPGLRAEQVADRLRNGASGVVASVGEPLRCLRGHDLFDWWKGEGKPRVVDPDADGWFLEELPDHRGWLATEWGLADASIVVSFEAIH